MVKIGFMLVVYLCGWVLAVLAGMAHYRTGPDGTPVKWRWADLWATNLMLFGVVFIAYVTVRMGYGEFLAVAMKFTGNYGQYYFLNEWAAMAEAYGVCAFWTLVATQCYRIGTSCSAEHFLQTLDGPEEDWPDLLKLEMPQYGDWRLEKASEACYTLCGQKYCRQHKNPAISESHLSMITSVDGRDGDTVISVETDELAHPHLRASEIAKMMLFAGWQATLYRAEASGDEETGCWEKSFDIPGKSHLGYAAELKFAALAKMQSERPRDYVDVADIVNVLKDGGVKLQRDPKVHEEWRATRAAET